MTPDDQLAALARRADQIVPEADLRAKLQRSARTGVPLRIKLGMDPTAPDVTLGHAVPLQVVRQFQDWGHRAVLIIGDYTARVGDPSGRNTTRPVLSGEVIDANAATYVAQIGKILRTDPAHLEVRRNGEWLAAMRLVDVIRLTSRATLTQVLQRHDFADRYAGRVEIRLHEILYPLLQGWDSVQIGADVELGGRDQLFNNLVGRELQRQEGGEGQVVIVTPLLVGLDGKEKMSKSKGNYIGVTDPPSGPDGMFGKIMSLPDTLMESYYRLLTDESPERYQWRLTTDPRGAKVDLARHIVGWLHGPAHAGAAAAQFEKQLRAARPPTRCRTSRSLISVMVPTGCRRSWCEPAWRLVTARVPARSARGRSTSTAFGSPTSATSS
jgi:tyrosyl-tRNA synthetase